ncbi:YggS family pyridoxal phosphate-dependent enzyme [Chlorobium sp. N1]|uniref:YggS family pyridoxal phosphate-dependent enzyme n=1 Tax=Chlorobium sp. N1 TaxID=2491138 RepID=UPI00103DC833|nr:YggS family pyridoxal phosphate-dependent enzyme [Chlorobium sp. N1]TCD47648.1 YggS family pyridoxal phosphate-dependent enzyme [Chlorobium sp. N1]
MDSISSNLAEIRRRIERAALDAGRDPATVRLVAVSKTKPAEMIREACEAGQTLFGESYMQEFLEKREDPVLEGCSPEWHFIGHLQSNKIRSLIGRVSLIHGIDKLSTARELSRQALKHALTADYLLEVNTSREETKYGMRPEEVETAAEELFALPSVRLRGLMTIAAPDPEAAELEFRELRELLLRLRKLAPRPEELTELSMGMSSDFEAAVREGATLVRVGTAIFGWR